MSGRFVRASKYRHVFGQDSKKDQGYCNLRPFTNGDSNFVSCSNTFVGLPYQGGGGPVLIQDITKTGRVGHGCPMLNVHKAKVLDIAFSPFADNFVATGSEDCHVKATLFPETGLTETLSEASASMEGHLKKVTQVDWHPTASNILASSSADSTIKCWDVEKQAEVLTFSQPEYAHAFQFNTNGSLICATGKDKNIRVYDPRSPDAASEFKGFEGTKASKPVWADNVEKLIVFGFTRSSMRQFSVFDPKKLGEPLITTDIDQSAGVMMPFYDNDTGVLFVGGKGDGNIKYFEVTAEDPYLHFLSEYRSSESQKGLGWLPKTACNTSKCEIARCMRLSRDWINPVSFQVPRKSDLFQEDLFPETYAGEPACTADEWVGGANPEPKKRSMKPGAGGGKAKMEFKAKKSPAQLQTELDAANAKIAELEAELKKLRS